MQACCLPPLLWVLCMENFGWEAQKNINLVELCAICLLLRPFLRVIFAYFGELNQCCRARGHVILPSRQGGGTMALHGGACIPGISQRVASKFGWSDTRCHSCMNDDELSLVPLDFWKFYMCSFGVGKKDLESMGLTCIGGSIEMRTMRTLRGWDIVPQMGTMRKSSLGQRIFPQVSWLSSSATRILLPRSWRWRSSLLALVWTRFLNICLATFERGCEPASNWHLPAIPEVC